jgi:hypothetical protein
MLSIYDRVYTNLVCMIVATLNYTNLLLLLSNLSFDNIAVFFTCIVDIIAMICNGLTLICYRLIIMYHNLFDSIASRLVNILVIHMDMCFSCLIQS